MNGEWAIRVTPVLAMMSGDVLVEDGVWLLGTQYNGRCC